MNWSQETLEYDFGDRMPQKEVGLQWTVTSSEKWIHYDSPKWWWDQKNTMCYEFLSPDETINRERRQQLIKLKRGTTEKCPEFVARHEAIFSIMT